MRNTIAMAALAAMFLAAGVARAGDDMPVCGDVNNTSSISTTDALLVLQKSVSLPITLQCTAYDNQFSGCVNALTEVNADLFECTGDLIACGTEIATCTDALSTTGMEIATCTDALSMTSADLTTCLRDVSSTFVAVGDGDSPDGGFVSTSTDGANWVDAATQPPGASKLNSVATNGIVFVAVDNGGKVFRSIDQGTTWIAAGTQPVGTFGLYDVATNGSSRFVAVGDGGVMFLSSDDGDTWVAASMSPDAQVAGLAARGPHVVAVGGSAVHVSSDFGDTWNAATTQPPGASQLTRVIAHADRFVAVGNIGVTGAVFTSSDDGATWVPATTQPPLPGFLIDSVASTGPGLVIGSYNGKVFVSADDGDTWVPAATNPVSNIAINGLACRGRFCAAGDLGGGTQWSPDSGMHWHDAYVQSVGIAGYYGVAR